MENKEFLRKIRPYGKLAVCAALCIATARTVASICDDEDVKAITKKIKSSAEVIKYMTAVSDVVSDD